MSSSARGSVAGPPANEPGEFEVAGVVKVVVPLVVAAAGENGNGDEPERDAEEGGVVDMLVVAVCAGR